MRAGLLRIAWRLCLLLGTVSNRAGGDEPAPRWGDRTLGGRTFIAGTSGQSAFLTTHAGIRQGIFVYTVPSFPVAGLEPVDVRVAGLVEEIDVGVKVADVLGLFASAEGRAISGIDAPSIVIGGATTRIGGRFGLAFRVFRHKRTATQLSLRSSLGYALGWDLDVRRLIGQVLDDARESPPQSPDELEQRIRDLLRSDALRVALTPSRELSYIGALTLAQALGPVFGIQVAIGHEQRRLRAERYRLDTREVEVASERGRVLFAAFSAEADLEPAGVPIAFQLEYLPSEEWNDAGQGFLAQPSKHTVTAGLYYSGRRNLQLGVLAATTRNLKPVQGLDGERRSGRPHLMFGELSMRYVW